MGLDLDRYSPIESPKRPKLLGSLKNEVPAGLTVPERRRGANLPARPTHPNS